MRKMVLVVCLLTLGMSVRAASLKNLVWIGPMQEQDISFTVSPDEGWLTYCSWPPSTIWVRGNWGDHQLATKFRPYDFIDDYGYYVGYPLWIKGARFLFFEHSDLPPWVTDKFRVIIYGEDGATKLYESKELKAIKNKEGEEWELTEYMLTDSIEITKGNFWIAIKTADTSSPTLTYTQPRQMHSFEGRPGSWFPHDGEWIILAGVNYTPTEEGIELSKASAPLTLEVVGSPAHSQVKIHYSLNKSGPATLEIFDSSGRPIRRLVSDKIEEGNHTIIWDGTDKRRKRVPNGAYFCRLNSNDSSIVKKIVLIR